MKVKQSKGFPNEFVCELTKELDELAGFDNNSLYYHYLLIDSIGLQDRSIAIRVPEGTVGSIWLDESSNKIVRVKVVTDYVVKSYPDDVLEHLDKFVGQILELGEEVVSK